MQSIGGATGEFFLADGGMGLGLIDSQPAVGLSPAPGLTVGSSFDLGCGAPGTFFINNPPLGSCSVALASMGSIGVAAVETIPCSVALSPFGSGVGQYTATGSGLTSNLASEAAATSLDLWLPFYAGGISSAAIAGAANKAYSLLCLATDSTLATIQGEVYFTFGSGSPPTTVSFTMHAPGVGLTKVTNAIAISTLTAAASGTGRLVLRCRLKNFHWLLQVYDGGSGVQLDDGVTGVYHGNQGNLTVQSTLIATLNKGSQFQTAMTYDGFASAAAGDFSAATGNPGANSDSALSAAFITGQPNFVAGVTTIANFPASGTTNPVPLVTPAGGTLTNTAGQFTYATSSGINWGAPIGGTQSSGTIGGSMSESFPVTAVLAGMGSENASALSADFATATLAGMGSIAGTSVETFVAAAIAAGAGTISAAALESIGTQVALFGAGTESLSAQELIASIVAEASSGSIAAAGTVANPVTVVVSLGGSGSLASAIAITLPATSSTYLLTQMVRNRLLSYVRWDGACLGTLLQNPQLAQPVPALYEVQAPDGGPYPYGVFRLMGRRSRPHTRWLQDFQIELDFYMRPRAQTKVVQDLADIAEEALYSWQEPTAGIYFHSIDREQLNFQNAPADRDVVREHLVASGIAPMLYLTAGVDVFP